MDIKEALLVAFITGFFSFGVQFLIYLYYRFIDHEILRFHRSVVHYSSGILGDGVFIPLVNIFCFFTLKALAVQVTIINFTVAVTGGVLITLFFHYYQEKLNLKNWTMPEKGVWNFLGMYHAIFMFCESSFLSFTLYNLIASSSTLPEQAIFHLPAKYSIALLGVFLLSFLYDYRSCLGFSGGPGQRH